MHTKSQIKPNAIQVTLGLKADGALPEVTTDKLGAMTTGPLGFLSLLEAQLGIASVETPFTTRLIEYLSCLDQADHAGAFYHVSYEADPFSVARTLLQWRDQWFLAGWQGTFKQDVPGKLADMAAIEQSARAAVTPGLGQRIQTVIALLAYNNIAISSINLRDPLTDFPHIWQRLIKATNTPVVEYEELSPQGREGTDLHKLQHQLMHQSTEKLPFDNDGSIVIIRAETALDSAPITAALIQKIVTESPDKSLAVLAETRGELLDESLEVIGTPRLGFNSLSPWRPIFQVLPLACELLWEPFNPTALFQFLSHSLGPIPARFREKLAHTAASVPGIGSEQWKNTIEKCLEKEDEKAKNTHKQNIHYWLESPRHSPQTGVDSATLADRAQRVADWLMGAREASNTTSLKSLYTIAISQTLEFVKAIDRLKAHGRGFLTRDNVLRLIEDVRGTGAPIADRQAEVTPGQTRALHAEHAGTFYNGIDKVIWWNCQATDHVQRWPWSQTERTALAANGVLLQSANEQLDCLGKAWLRPVLAAREQCIVVLHNDAENHHPAWDQILSATEGLPIVLAADSDLTEALGVPQGVLSPHALPPKSRWWQLLSDTALLKRSTESYSSLDAYINSPYQWLLRYAAKVEPGSLIAIADGNLLKGNLAHRLYQQFFTLHPDIAAIDSTLASTWVNQYTPILLEQEGAVLLEPGRKAEGEHFIDLLRHSLSVLVEQLQQANVIKVQMELWQEGLYTGGGLNGSIDLLATCADGSEAVVDIKLGGGNYRREALHDSSYLQLATYGQLRLAAGAASYPKLSYFIVVDAQMLSLDHDFFPTAECIVPQNHENQAQYWKRFEDTWHWRKDQFDKGLVEVTIADTEPTALSNPGESGLAIPDASDTFSDFTVLTGWDENA